LQPALAPCRSLAESRASGRVKNWPGRRNRLPHPDRIPLHRKQGGADGFVCLAAREPIFHTFSDCSHAAQYNWWSQSRAVLLALLLPFAAFAEKRPVNLDDVTATRSPRAGSGAIHWAADGKRFAYRDGNSIWLYDVP